MRGFLRKMGAVSVVPSVGGLPLSEGVAWNRVYGAGQEPPQLQALLRRWRLQSAGASSRGRAPLRAAGGDDAGEGVQRLARWLSPWEAQRLHAALARLEAHRKQGPGGMQPGFSARRAALAQEVSQALEGLWARWQRQAQQQPAAWTLGVGPWFAQAQAEALAAQGRCRRVLRQALAQGGPRLKRLAALDALWEEQVAALAQQAWAELPRHLAQRVGEEALVALPPQPQAVADALALLGGMLRALWLPLWGIVEAAGAEEGGEGCPRHRAAREPQQEEARA